MCIRDRLYGVQCGKGKERRVFGIIILVAYEQVLNACGGEEIFLFETQYFSGTLHVVGIQHARNIFGAVYFAQGIVVCKRCV